MSLVDKHRRATKSYLNGQKDVKNVYLKENSNGMTPIVGIIYHHDGYTIAVDHNARPDNEENLVAAPIIDSATGNIDDQFEKMVGGKLTKIISLPKNNGGTVIIYKLTNNISNKTQYDKRLMMIDDAHYITESPGHLANTKKREPTLLIEALQTIKENPQIRKTLENNDLQWIGSIFQK